MSFARLSLPLALSALLTAAPSTHADLDKDREHAHAKRQAIRDLFVADQQAPEALEEAAATPCVGGMADIYPCLEVDLLAFMPLASIGGGNGNDVWGWTDPMTGNEYAIMGRSSGTSFVDITDPENPVYLGNLPPHGANSSWRDIKVYSDHAYIVSEAAGHGMQVFDLTELRSVAAPPVTFSETAHYDNFGSAHNLAINEDTGFAYAVGSASCSGGPHFVDLANPVVPVFAGCHVETVYTHDTQCVVYNGPDPDYTGREICFSSNETKVSVIDVTDHSNSTLISETIFSQTGYIHQGWLTEDQRYYMQGDELDEQNFGHNTRTWIVDMADLDAPVIVDNFDHATSAIDHNMYTHEGYVYQANYRAGLRILDLDDIAAGTLTEVAYFDIYPSSDGASFNGAWSVYPYFASGTVVVSGIEQGLFILKPKFAPAFELDVAPTQFEVCEPDLAAASVQLTDENGYVGSVTLSTSGLPAGAIESFSVNPVAVPGSSMMSISVSGTTPGDYVFTVSGTDGTLTKDAIMQLKVADQAPGQPAAVSPVDGAIDVSRTPSLEWSAATQAAEYSVEISVHPGFGSLAYSATTSGTTHIVAESLEPTTMYYWRVRATNPCGTGTASAVASFTTLDVPDILVVDDDDNGPDVSSAYTSALLALGRDFDLWDTNNTDDEPSAAALEPYTTVLWFSGDEFGGAAGPGAGGEQALAGWLDASGCLLISSQDYHYDRGMTTFITNYLGVSFVSNDISQTSADGRGIFEGIGPYTLAFPYSNFTDTVLPGSTAQQAFQGSISSAGVQKDTGIYRTAYLGFGIEALPSAAARETTLSTFLAWCEALAGMDPDSDGATNETDCAPADPDVWSAPSEVSGLTLTEAASDNLSWSAPAVTGTAVGVTYDVLRSGGAADFMSGICMETDDTDTIATDTAIPAEGGLYYYLVRVENGCGDNLGNGGSRDAIGCP